MRNYIACLEDLLPTGTIVSLKEETDAVNSKKKKAVKRKKRD